MARLRQVGGGVTLINDLITVVFLTRFNCLLPNGEAGGDFNDRARMLVKACAVFLHVNASEYRHLF